MLAPNSIADCLAPPNGRCSSAEALQAPAIVLSDQFMGQSRAVIDRPAQPGVPARRLTAPAATDGPA
ncbi:MAG: 2-oxoglutarate synthase, partial [Betaproteobacteria bacterium]|nr:2-oxoglutarate synthase [Betaproteobacteria bacterium]